MRELKPQPQPADIAALRELEEVREIRARRRLLGEEAKQVRQRRVRERVETGHRRFALIQRFLFMAMTLVSFVLALLGSLSLVVALVLAGGAGGLGLAAQNGRGKRGD